jgi:hypothetical protein
MAAQNLSFNRMSPAGARLAGLIASLDRTRDIADEIQVMTLMIDGDGSDDAHYAEITTRYGFASNAKSHSAFDELNSVLGKLNTDGSVSNVKSAIAQAVNKFRG